MRSQNTSRRRGKIAGRIRNVWQGPVPASNAAPEQQVSLLVPKLRRPRISSSLVVRERLFVCLDAGLERKVTVLCAPAGFGKTTVVNQWITRHQTSSDNRQHLLPVAWVSLDSNDNDPLRFWRYVITACQAWQNGLGVSALALLRSAQEVWRPSLRQASLEAALTSMLNETTQLQGQGILVLEDYHMITATRIHETLASFIEHLPTTLHLVLITRSEPALPLARWRAQDQLSELQAADLRFSEDEIITILQQAIPFMLTGDELQRLLERTEGWGVGLRLLTLALQGHKTEAEIENVLTTFAGNHRHLLAYFVTEVLDAQPESWQRFLLQTSILSRLTGSLCDAVTERNDSERQLEAVERAGLFLLPLDGAGQWYRYHALFAEAMQHEAHRRLGEDVLRTCSLRASRWYEEHDMLMEAIEAALTASEYTYAAALMGGITQKPSHVNAGKMSTLRNWLEQVPELVLQEQPILGLTSVIMYVFTSERYPPVITAQMEERLQAAERIWSDENNTFWLGKMIALRALLAVWQDRLHEAASLAEKALTCLPEEDHESRSMCTGAIAEDARQQGQFERAQQLFREALSLCIVGHNEPGARVFRLSLGDVYCGTGALHESAEFYRQVLSEAGNDLIDKARAQLGLAQISYEWNTLEAAEQEAQSALQLGQQLLDETLQVQATILLARIHVAQEETAQALQLVQTQLARLHPTAIQLQRRELQMWLARFQYATGDLAAMQRWIATYGEGNVELPLLQREQEALWQARWLIVQDRAQEALTLLDHWQEQARRAGRTRALLEMQMLKVRVYNTLLQKKDAQHLLLGVLAQTFSEGYQRLFLDEGEMMENLLRGMLPDIREKALQGYALGIVNTFARTHGEQSHNLHHLAASPLQESLSEQELRVLRLLAAGQTRQEIANELVVSVNTVKTHLQRIYRKLNVTNHGRACEVARNLHLL